MRKVINVLIGTLLLFSWNPNKANDTNREFSAETNMVEVRGQYSNKEVEAII